MNFAIFCSYLGNYLSYNIEIWYGGAPRAAGRRPVERSDVRPSGHPWGTRRAARGAVFRLKILFF